MQWQLRHFLRGVGGRFATVMQSLVALNHWLIYRSFALCYLPSIHLSTPFVSACPILSLYAIPTSVWTEIHSLASPVPLRPPESCPGMLSPPALLYIHGEGLRKPRDLVFPAVGKPISLGFLPAGKRIRSRCGILSNENIDTGNPSLAGPEKPGAKAAAVEQGRSLMLKNKAVEISYELKGTSIFLVGMNGTMKTELGKLLAEVLRYYYFDSDSLVEQAAGGESAAKYFREKDEKGFRDSETEVLKQLSSMGRLVISAGDGAVQSSANLAYLRYGISVWIDVPLVMLAKEAMESGSQSPFRRVSTSDSYSEVIAKLTSLYEEMKGGYATADATVSVQKAASQLGYSDVDAVTPEDIVIEVLKEIEKLTRVKKMMEEAARPF